MEEKDLEALPEEGVISRLRLFPGWKYESGKIVKTLEFDSFTDAVHFVDALVDFCNSLDHHPDIFISYKKIRFELTTFSVGGKVTERDFTVAQRIESDFQKYTEGTVK